MKNIILVLIVLLTISSCTYTPIETFDPVPPIAEGKINFVCEAPYIQVGAECCLDQNTNKICDKDEPVIETTEPNCHLISPFECKYAEIQNGKIYVNIKFLKPDITFVKSISFPRLNCTVNYNAPTAQWITDPLEQYSYVPTYENIDFEIPCEIPNGHINSDWQVSYVKYNDGVPYGDQLRYLYNEEDRTYGTFEN